MGTISRSVADDITVHFDRNRMSDKDINTFKLACASFSFLVPLGTTYDFGQFIDVITSVYTSKGKVAECIDAIEKASILKKFSITYVVKLGNCHFPRMTTIHASDYDIAVDEIMRREKNRDLLNIKLVRVSTCFTLGRLIYKGSDDLSKIVAKN